VATSLLKAKLYIPPVRPELVPRPRLIERLNAGLVHRRKLTLISAPAGFGKTTLLSEWIDQSPIPNTQYPNFAWLSLDESDNDATRFLTYFVAALQTIEARSIHDVLTFLLQHLPPPERGLCLVIAGDPYQGWHWRRFRLWKSLGNM
jgi:LuxR family maltose regulon positive regulatory protein